VCLCSINAAWNRAFLERVLTRKRGCKVTLSLEEMPMRINGDDLLLAIPDDCYQEWKDWMSIVGLKPSMGKNYLSKDFGLINSELYLAPKEYEPLSWEPEESEFKRIHRIPVGLLLGMGRVQNDTRDTVKVLGDGRRISSIGARLDKALEGHTEPQTVEWIRSMFIDCNRDLLYSTKRDWVLPRHLGGLGMNLGERQPGKYGQIVAWWIQSSEGQEHGIKGHEILALSAGLLCPPPHVKEAMKFLARFRSGRMIEPRGEEDLPLLAAQFAHMCEPEENETLSLRKDPYDGYLERALKWASQRADIPVIDYTLRVPEFVIKSRELRQVTGKYSLSLRSGTVALDRI